MIWFKRNWSVLVNISSRSSLVFRRILAKLGLKLKVFVFCHFVSLNFLTTQNESLLTFTLLNCLKIPSIIFICHQLGVLFFFKIITKRSLTFKSTLIFIRLFKAYTFSSMKHNIKWLFLVSPLIMLPYNQNHSYFFTCYPNSSFLTSESSLSFYNPFFSLSPPKRPF